MNKKLLIIILIVLILILSGIFFYVIKYSDKAPNQTELNPGGCSAKGGEIINILNDERADDLIFRRDHKAEFCKNKKDYLGDVIGLHCPCICCIK